MVRRAGPVIVLLLMVSGTAAAGPPFFTDDPVPVELHHSEIYFAFQYLKADDGRSGALPFIDMNYGALPDLHLHMTLPGAFNRPNGGRTFYGFGDYEFGFKYRFIHETAWRPQVAIYPAVDFPTGDSDRGLGNGKAQVFLPLWLQKSWGSWTTYGGAGYWFHSGGERRDWVYAGWVVQRDFSKWVTLGAEVFHRTRDAVDTHVGTGFSVGGQVNFGEHYHLMSATGRDFSGGPNQLTEYLALQWTF